MGFIAVIVGYLLTQVSWETAAPAAAALIAGAAAGLRYFYDLGNQRLGTTDAIASDMLSIGGLFLSARIIDSFIALTNTPNAFLPAGFADKARQENYFAVYEKYIEKLGNLDSESIKAVTAFYAFLRASRDATRTMELWKEPYYDEKMKRNDVIHILYQCLLFGVSGEIALRRLRDDDRKLAAVGVFVLIQIRSIQFLNTTVEFRPAIPTSYAVWSWK
jgi:hypothetical protein